MTQSEEIVYRCDICGDKIPEYTAESILSHFLERHFDILLSMAFGSVSPEKTN